ncbi:MAG: tetratricopeptide repeat protein, partial [Gemmataceae bacterium]|nr:tetratricopeptide repeat protein [Gemmataceae bacterium]
MSDTSTPDPFDAAYSEGARLFEQHRFNEAVEAFARAASHRPDDFRPWEMTACCHGSAGRWQQCADAFDRARQLGHECARCCYNRATALINLQRADEARQSLERAVELEPTDAAAWYELGLILGMGRGADPSRGEPFDGRHERAVVAFDRVLALQPDHYGAWYCKAYTLYKISHSLGATQGLIALGYPPDAAQQALACSE